MPVDPEEPPEYGEMEFVVPIAPVSRQASADSRRVLTDAVRVHTRPLKYLLDDDVTVDIEWTLHERSRWESDAAADVDNIVKPLLDALSGPEGVLIDDCQVRSFSSTWRSWVRDEDQVLIRIKYDADHFVPKDGLVFVRIQGALCYPVPREIREKGATEPYLEALRTAMTARENMEQLTRSYYPARYLVPRGCFHRTRLDGFDVRSPDELLRMS